MTGEKDFSIYEKECRMMGGLFQQLAHEMKSSSSVWQDFNSKANKLYQALGSSTVAVSSFIDSLQKIADLANHSKGAVKDIGAMLTRLCLRQRAMEEKMKDFVTILGGTFSPIPGLQDDWKKCVVQMDHAHAKEYKKVDKEIQKGTYEVAKLKKQIDRGGNSAKLQPSLDSKIQSVEYKYNDLATNQSVALKKLALHERQRFAFFVKCLLPLLEKQHELMIELSQVDDVITVLSEKTKDSESIIKHCEDFVDDFRLGNSTETELPFVTPPGSPKSGLSRHSSSFSLRSGSSNLSQLRRSKQLLHNEDKKSQQEDRKSQQLTEGTGRNSQLSFSASHGHESDFSQETLVGEQINYGEMILTPSPLVSPNSPPLPSPPNLSTSNRSLAIVGNRKTFAGYYGSIRRSNSKLNKNDLEDGELVGAHRDPFQRATALRHSLISAPNKTNYTASLQALHPHQNFQPLDSPLRPGRKNDQRNLEKRATHTGNSRLEAAKQLEKAASSLDEGPRFTSPYATLGRGSYKSFNPERSSFHGNSISSAGRINNSGSIPPPPPPPPFIMNTKVDADQQIAVLLAASTKKSIAPLPPQQQTPSQPPSTPQLSQHKIQPPQPMFKPNQSSHYSQSQKSTANQSQAQQLQGLGYQQQQQQQQQQIQEKPERPIHKPQYRNIPINVVPNKPKQPFTYTKSNPVQSENQSDNQSNQSFPPKRPDYKPTYDKTNIKYTNNYNFDNKTNTLTSPMTPNPPSNPSNSPSDESKENSIPIKIFHKYSEGLSSPEPNNSKIVFHSSTSPPTYPYKQTESLDNSQNGLQQELSNSNQGSSSNINKPPPPIRNSSMSDQPQQNEKDKIKSEPLSKRISFREQGAPLKCAVISPAAPISFQEN